MWSTRGLVLAGLWLVPPSRDSLAVALGGAIDPTAAAPAFARSPRADGGLWSTSAEKPPTPPSSKLPSSTSSLPPSSRLSRMVGTSQASPRGGRSADGSPGAAAALGRTVRWSLLGVMRSSRFLSLPTPSALS